jgi:hypothetical protein
MSFETTMRVRVLRGSTPTDRSQFTHTMSPRRMVSLGALLVIEEPLELRMLEIAKHVPGILDVPAIPAQSTAAGAPIVREASGGLRRRSACARAPRGAP